MKTQILISAAAGAVLCAALGPAAQADEAACARVEGRRLPAEMIALPTTGARVTKAQFVAGKDGAAPFCRLLGEIAPVDPTAPKINFQLNLPENWNGKMVQFGGGGLNGQLVTGEAPARDQPPGPTPLMQGYATFGTDGGHQTARGEILQAFALNDEALINHAYAAYKKTHDAALSLASAYYGKKPARMYHFGGSEGGRESMSAVQRFPQDYDGVVATVPGLAWTGMQFTGYDQWQRQRAGGWMSPAKVKLVEKSAADACDAKDGLTDGIIADYGHCDASKTLAALRCPAGEDRDGCLSDAQIALVTAVRSPLRFGVPLKNGDTVYPAYGVGNEAFPGNFIPTVITAVKPAPDDDARGVYAVGDVRYFFMKDPAFSAPLDAKANAKRIQYISQIMDMTDPDLSKFAARGGKLIMKSNGSDVLISPRAAWHYYEAVVRKMGKARADQFLRLYVAPQTGHGGSGASTTTGAAVPDKVDLLGALDAWVDQGKAPGADLTLTSYSKDNQPIASWPLCHYPAYPRYAGSGDPKAAASYRCSVR